LSPPAGADWRARTARWPRSVRLGLTVLIALAAALLARASHLPLPWMIGPLLVTSLLGVTGVPVLGSNRLRNAGQWVIGTTLGLYFTPVVLEATARIGWAIGLGVLWALLLGYGHYRFLWWRHRRDGLLHPGSAFFSASIGGASEMALLAERHGAQVDRVAAAHSLRVLLVVVLIPFAFKFSGLHGVDPAAAAMHEVHPAGLAVLALLTVAASLIASRLDLPSPFVLGALAVTIALTASGVDLSAMPGAVIAAGQLCIGVALGTRFTREFLHAGPRWLASVAMGTLGMMVVSAGFAVGLAHLAGLHPATVILGTSPGGISEMSITAQALELGVPMVTAFHVVRYVAVLLLTGSIWRVERRRLHRQGRLAG